MFVQLNRLLPGYSLLRLPCRRISSYSNNKLYNTSLRVTPVTKRQAAASMANECTESIVVFMNDDNPADVVNVPPLDTMSAITKDKFVFYVAGFVIKHCVKVLRCCTCISAISGVSSQLPQIILINVKLRGSLRWPSEALFLAFSEAEEYISSRLAKDLDLEAFTELLVMIIPVF